MLGENTVKALNEYGNDITKFAKININDRNRKRKSKLTGKTRRGKLESSGRLRASFESEIKEMPNSFTMAIKAEDYAQDVNDGAKRKTSLSKVLQWVKKKPIRFRVGNKFVKATKAKQLNFAKFVKWKVEHVGSDYSGYLDDAITLATEKHQEELEDGIFKDIETAADVALRSLE
jgi:hypothetical protein